MDQIVTYTVKDIKEIFHCGDNVAYSIMSAKGFPSIKIGKKFIVEKTALEKWLEHNKGKEIFT